MNDFNFESSRDILKYVSDLYTKLVLLPLLPFAFLRDMMSVVTAFKTKEISDSLYRGRGHFPLCFSSSIYFLRTSWNLWRSAVTASFPATSPSLSITIAPLSLSIKEKCKRVSKHVLANSSLNVSSVSESTFVLVAEWMEPLFNKMTTFRMNSLGMLDEYGRTSVRSNSIIWQSIASSDMRSSKLRSAGAHL